MTAMRRYRWLAFVLIGAMLVNLAGCGGGGGSNTAPPPGDGDGTPPDVPTQEISCTVDAADLHVDEATVNVMSSWREQGVRQEAAQRTIVSSESVQLVIAEDGELRGLALSIPEDTTTASDTPLTIDVASTALALAFISPGILSTEAEEARARAAELRQLAKFAEFVSVLEAELASGTLQEAFESGACQSALSDVIQAWMEDHGRLTTQLVQVGLPNADFIVSVDSESDTGSTQLRLQNWGWRCVHVIRREVADDDTNTDHVVASAMSGAIPVSWGSLFMGVIGSPATITDTVNFGPTNNCSRAEYWLIGPGNVGRNDVSPPEGIPSWSEEAWEKSLIQYCVLPVIDLAFGCVSTNNVAERVGQIYAAVHGTLDIGQAIQDQDPARLSASLAGLTFSVARIALQGGALTWVGAGAATFLNVLFIAGLGTLAASNFLIVASTWSELPTCACIPATYFQDDGDGGEGGNGNGGGGGHIAFTEVTWDDGVWGYLFYICTIRPDRTGFHQLTEGGNDHCPACSPDGTEIAYTYSREWWGMGGHSGESALHIMNADGSNDRLIAENPNDEDDYWYPSWSPNGDRIVFSARRGGAEEIYVINVDGSGEARLTEGSDPDWSPDGQRIVFVRDGRICIMNADASNQRVLTPTECSEDYDPVWSPDGSRLAFVRYDDVWIMNADGTDQTRLTNTPLREGDPTWSPDGSRIAFAETADVLQIYTMAPDGSNVTTVTSLDYAARSPDWSPQ